MQYSTIAEFDSDLKQLLKRYRSLKEDIERLKSVLEKYPRGYAPVIYRIDGLGIETEVYKVTHFRCTSMKSKGSRSGVRIVYTYFDSEKRIEFVQIYYKEKDDLDCDRSRIYKYYKGTSKNLSEHRCCHCEGAKATEAIP